MGKMLPHKLDVPRREQGVIGFHDGVKSRFLQEAFTETIYCRLSHAAHVPTGVAN